MRTAREPVIEADGRWSVSRLVLQFLVAGIVAVAIVGIATAVASRRVGQREAIADARTTTLIKAQTIVEPVVTDGLATGSPDAVDAVGRVVEAQVLDDSLVRVKIWARDGRIVYSDEAQLIGAQFELGEDEVEAIDNGVIEAEISDLGEPENRFERGEGKLLEVYLPIRLPGGERLLFEAYFKYDAVSASGSHIWRSFAPVSIGGLVALELVQIPIAWSLARRLRARQREREHLLQQAVESSLNERRRIASDLHDGVVQDLVGVAYGLAGAARSQSSAPNAELLDRSADQVRDSIKSLRTLLVDIYPPKLAEAGLPAALTDLVATASARGLRTAIDVERLSSALPDSVAALVYRAAQEALRNVVTHAGATSVALTATSQDGSVVLDVVDDGAGFDTAAADQRAGEGHLGLRGLADLAEAVGGRLEVESGVDSGTRLHLEVPVP
jgi:two-component system, NarL family, sensor kinase